MTGDDPYRSLLDLSVMIIVRWIVTDRKAHRSVVTLTAIRNMTLQDKIALLPEMNRSRIGLPLQALQQ